MSRRKESQMKRSSKNLVVLSVIAAIGMFATVAMAWDAPKWKNTIEGEYAMIATGTCLQSESNFNSNYTVTGSWPGSSAATGIWTFKSNGQGTITGTQYALTLPPNPNPSAATGSFSFNFTYTMPDDDTINLTLVGQFKLTYLTGPLKGWTSTTNTYDLSGNISVDKKTITLISGGTEIQEYTLTPPSGSSASPFNVYAICNIGRVLTRLDE